MDRLPYFQARFAERGDGELLEYKRVSIRDQRSRWGSCSAKKNLNFNYRLVHLPPALVDYVIAHELCHLKEFNHAPAFWALLERVMPDARACQAELKKVTISRV
jgi:predicted metal-dependent hydrolase